MSNNECTPCCGTISIIASIIIGILTLIFSAIGTIFITKTFSWVLFTIAIVYLAVLFITSHMTRKTGCICFNSGKLLTGILGTILFSAIIMVLNFVEFTYMGALIPSLAIFFFSLMITQTACIVKCTACKD